jgi:lysozyme family protein
MNFDDAFTKLVDPQHEGGYVNDPRDPGGETKYGISKRSYPDEDIASLTLERAKAIYARDFWHPAGCEAVPALLAYDLFDMAVNQGLHAAIKALQFAAGVADDGVLGPNTLRAVQRELPIRLLFRFDAARLVHYAEARDDQLTTYGRGWLHRTGSNMTSV